MAVSPNASPQDIYAIHTGLVAAVRRSEDESHGLLEGLVVLEVGTTSAGPVAAAELADLGAEVITCELPVTGDVCRQFGPRVPNAPAQDASAPFLSINRNKKAIGAVAKFPNHTIG